MRRRFIGKEIPIYSYLVYSNSDGAKVYFDGNEVGTIQDGQLQVDIPNGNDSYEVTLSGGLPEENVSYSLELSPTSLSFMSGGGNSTFTVTSILHRVTYSNTSGIVYKGESVTLNWIQNSSEEENVGYTTSVSGTGFTISGTTVTASSNQSSTSTTTSRTGKVTVTQSSSNISKTISLTQEGRVMYSYTVNSNCEGGTVKTGSTNRGTISSSKLVFYDSTGGSKTITISGGVPSNYTDTGSESTTEYDLSVTSGSATMSFDASGSSSSISVKSVYRTGSRSTSTPVTYSAPSSANCAQNSSVTMNYSTSRGTTSYGNWSYGTWTNRTSSITGVPSWASSSKSTSGSTHTYTITASENTSTSSRSGSARINQSSSGKSVALSLSQAGREVAYVFTLADGTNIKSYTYDSSSRTLKWTVTSTADGSFTDFTIEKADTTSMATVTKSRNVVTCVLLANSSSKRSCIMVFKQTASGKTITIAVTQEAALPSIVYYNNDRTSLTVAQRGGTVSYGYRHWDSNGSWVAGSDNLSSCSWMSGKTTAEATNPNYKTFTLTVQSNTGFTDRSFTITSTPSSPSSYSNGSTTSSSITVNQPGRPNSFNISRSGSGITACIMLSSVTLPTNIGSNQFASTPISTGTTQITNIIRSINSSNVATVGSPFTLSSTSISVKVYQVSGSTTSNWTLLGTYYGITPGGTINL